MGNRSAVTLHPDEIAEIQRDTGFSPNQISRLYSRFVCLDKHSSGSLTRQDFIGIPELAINPLGDRIVHAFFQEGEDEDAVNFRQFMRTLAHFRPVRKAKNGAYGNTLNSREEKLRFAFRMYDLDADGLISREELLAVLHMMVGANISEEQLGSIADRTIAEADKDGDRAISFEEFCKCMERVDVEQKMSIRFLH